MVVGRTVEYRLIDVYPKEAIVKIRPQKMYKRGGEWGQGKFVQMAFVPDLIEGLTHVKQYLSLIHI